MNESKPTRIAVIMDYLFSGYQSDLRWGIERYIAEEGIQAVYFGIGSLNINGADAVARERMFSLINPAEFDGILLVSSTLMNSSGIERLRAHIKELSDLPLVAIGPPVGGEDSVQIDGAAGMRELMAHMIEFHGYRDLAFVSGPFTSPEAMERLEVFNSSLDRYGIPRDPLRVYEGNFLQSSGNAAVEAFLEERRIKPRAIVCASDYMAIGVWKGLRAHGLSVPHDVAISGFDDLQISPMMSHRFTTVRQPLFEQSWQGVRRLHDMILGRIDGPPTRLPSELRIRSSCGCLEMDRRQERRVKASSGERMQALGSKLEVHGTVGFTGLEVRSLCQDWARIVGQALEEKKSIHEVEQMLASLCQKWGAPANPSMEMVLSAFRAILLEEFGQAQVVHSVFDSAIMSGLSSAIDGFQEALMASHDETAHPALVKRIGDQCHSKAFRIALFADPCDPLAGAKVVYGGGDPDWKPGPGNWVPRGDRGTVVNALIIGSDTLGYLVMSSDIENYGLYDYIDTRLSSLFHDLRLMQGMKAMNARMQDEIRVREETERRLKEALAQVERMSIEDELTGLRNRRGFLTLAEQEILLLRRQRNPFMILFADVDGLKCINDTYGHKDGDDAIRGAAKALKAALRESDVVARIGGDEFTALIVDAKEENSKVIHERIDSRLAEVNRALCRPWRLSLSVGFYCVSEDCREDVNWMMSRADEELYRRKQEKKRP